MTKTKALVNNLLLKSAFKHKMKSLQIQQKLVYEEFYLHEKILRTQNHRRKFIKNLLPEKRKEKV